MTTIPQRLRDAVKNKGLEIGEAWNLLDEAADKIERLQCSLTARQARLDLLHSVQSRMRDPERTLVCDVLANGALLPDPDGARYGLPADSVARDADRYRKLRDGDPEKTVVFVCGTPPEMWDAELDAMSKDPQG